MAEQITKQQLGTLFEVASNNFKFKLPDGFEMIFNMIFEQVKDIDSLLVQKRFQQLLLTSNEEWNKKYGFAGYPSLSDWIKILAGDRPLTDEEKHNKIEEHKTQMRIYTAQIASGWLDDERFNIRFAFVGRYRNPENAKLRAIIDEFAKVKKELTDERVLDLANYLHKELLQDKVGFFDKMLGIAKKQNPPPFQIENRAVIEQKPKQEQRALPTINFKTI
jgi:hypothetical protein